MWASNERIGKGYSGHLKTIIRAGMNPDFAQKLAHLPEDIRVRWPKPVYTRFTADKISMIDEIIEMLQHPAMDFSHKLHALKVFTSLSTFLKILPEAEKRTNTVISFLKTGLLQQQEEAAS